MWPVPAYWKLSKTKKNKNKNVNLNNLIINILTELFMRFLLMVTRDLLKKKHTFVYLCGHKKKISYKVEKCIFFKLTIVQYWNSSNGFLYKCLFVSGKAICLTHCRKKRVTITTFSNVNTETFLKQQFWQVFSHCFRISLKLFCTEKVSKATCLTHDSFLKQPILQVCCYFVNPMFQKTLVWHVLT